jgi:DNA-binding LytR/AlgR family response regulator
MQKLQCVIIEDHAIDAEYLLSFIKQYDFLEHKVSFANPLEAHGYIEEYKPPVVFMDIDMPIVNGMDYFKQLKYEPICIFVTAYSEYAWEGFEAQAFDYILKPVKENRFEQTMQRLQEYLLVKQRADLYDTLIEENTITIKEGTIKHVININDILYIEALKDYSKVVTEKQKILTLSKLKHFLEKLPASQFVRVHRSYAIALNKVQKASQNDVYIHNKNIPIGKTFKNTIKLLL